MLVYESRTLEIIDNHRTNEPIPQLLLLNQLRVVRRAKEAARGADTTTKLATRRTVGLASATGVRLPIVRATGRLIIIIVVGMVATTRRIGRTILLTTVRATSAVRLLDAFRTRAIREGPETNTLPESRRARGRTLAGASRHRTTSRLNDDRDELTRASYDRGDELLNAHVASHTHFNVVRRQGKSITFIVLDHG